MDRTELARAIRNVSYLTGEFLLRSGKTSNFYWDKYRFESNPIILAAVAEEMARLLPRDFDLLAGLEMGGIPLATALSLKSGRRALFVRKEAKTYGTCNLVEGGFEKGQKIVVIEDVITTAGQVCISVNQMREMGLVVPHVICAIDRKQGGAEKIAELGCTFSSVFTLDDLQG